MAKTVPVIVSLSGKIDLSIEDNMTTEDISKYIKLLWGINPETIESAFVVVSNSLTGDNALYEEATHIYDSLNSKSIIRVVMPLAIKNYEETPQVVISPKKD